MAGIVRRDLAAPGSSSVHAGSGRPTIHVAPGTRHRWVTTAKETPDMAELIAFVLASLPLVAFVALVVETVSPETFRPRRGQYDVPPAVLLRRAYSA
jgi:hypothetical protein